MSQSAQFSSISTSSLARAFPRFKVGLTVVLLLAGIGLLMSAAVSWVTTPDYSTLVYGLSDEEARHVASELQGHNIFYRYDKSVGEMLVLTEQLQQAQSQLAIPGMSFSRAFETGPFIAASDNRTHPEQKGFPHQVLETELAKSIASIDHVQSARLHLALVERGSKNGDDVSRASVVVRLHQGRRLSESQIASISHLIASSVPNLLIDNITIIDQSGKLLKAPGGVDASGLSSAQLSLIRQFEQSHADRIENILEPILGANAVRIQVVADVAFSSPTTMAPVVRDDIKTSDKLRAGQLQRITATVIVDYRIADSGNGQTVQVKRSDQELARIAKLVKHAIGFDDRRGDVVTIINEPFIRHFNRTTGQSIPIWIRLSHDVSLRYLGAGLLVLFVGLVLLRRVRKVGGKSVLQEVVDSGTPSEHQQYVDENKGVTTADTDSMPGQQSNKQILESAVKQARQFVHDDPKIVAQIIKGWVKEGG